MDSTRSGDWGNLASPYHRHSDHVTKLSWIDQESVELKTNYGGAFDVAAPGIFRYSLPDDGKVPGEGIAGTSYATPMVSVLALLLSAMAESRPEDYQPLSPGLARARIIGTSDLFVGDSRAAKFGLINYRRPLWKAAMNAIVTCDVDQ